MMISSSSDISCGINMISGLHGIPARNLLRRFLECYERADYDPPAAIILFSDVVRSPSRMSRGERLYAELLKHPELGSVECSETRKNHNSGNNIKLFYWMPNDDYRGLLLHKKDEIDSLKAKCFPHTSEYYSQIYAKRNKFIYPQILKK